MNDTSNNGKGLSDDETSQSWVAKEPEKMNIVKIETEEEIKEMTQAEALRSGQLKAIDKTLIGEDVYNFYFNQKVTPDVRDILSDCVSREHWASILEKYRDGHIDTDDMTDVLLISHLQVGGNDLATPEEIVDRAFDSKFRGKLGRKLIANTIHALSEAQLLKAPEHAVRAVVDQSIAQSDPRSLHEHSLLLVDNKKPEQEADNAKMQTVADQAFDDFLSSLNIADQVRDIEYEDFLKALADEENPYFDFAVQMCFDMGWEKPSKHENPEKPEPKCLALYFFELDKAWTDTAEHNVKQADRHVSRWLIRDIKLGEWEKVQKVKDSLAAKFSGRLDDKLSFMKVMWERNLG